MTNARNSFFLVEDAGALEASVGIQDVVDPLLKALLGCRCILVPSVELLVGVAGM